MLATGSHFRVLGRVEWSVDGRPRAIGRRRERLLLGLLLLEMGRSLPMDRLIDLLSDEDERPPSRTDLYVHVCRLRASLRQGGCDGSVRLVRSGSTYALTGDPQLVDLHRFTQLVNRAQRGTEPQEVSRLASSALAEWRGAVLEDVASERTRRGVGTAFDELLISAQLLRVAAEFKLRNYWSLAAELARLTEDHPEHEMFLAFRAATLYECGRRADALRVLSSARARMTARLGLDLSRELQDLREAILRGNPMDRRIFRCGALGAV
ncbi:AfsR/SARP family transcriptional regulator [Streptomyces sp. NBC_00841]|uniref:AfsR/SARP family transcriptional regulator n=1 Tax=unclassified Streptomyces TaxID=2593676 RepID=UPI00224E2C33|nr:MULTISPECIES: AfsR/SARP family transcriptional regulator [unclassified Streptomyces]MCX4532911.1 AfsR/SARP family transcriptional regulator [Streptomyces sp. NBC_01669]WSA01634.1 AfsR/SARP family transcriptional regulator [Streptomyces sp. NBC_00841]